MQLIKVDKNSTNIKRNMAIRNNIKKPFQLTIFFCVLYITFVFQHILAFRKRTIFRFLGDGQT